MAAMSEPALRLDRGVGHVLAMQPSPALLAYAEILALDSAELAEAIGRELDENPALERREFVPGWSEGGGDGGALAQVPAATTAAETMLSELGPMLRGREPAVAEYLLASLDRRGFLRASAEEVASVLRVDRDLVERVLGLVRAAGPPGLAAPDLRSCLLCQLAAAGDADDPVASLARRIVESHLHDLAAGRLRLIARSLDSCEHEVARAVERVAALDPSPGAGLGGGPVAPPAVPDVVIRTAGDDPPELIVKVAEEARFALALSPAYVDALGGQPGATGLGHVRSQLAKANDFIGRLGRRWCTMRAVAEVAAERQRRFLLGEAVYPAALTRAAVAAELGVHESTVSRAVAGRHVLLPSGRLVPMASLFPARPGVRDELARLVAEERRPLSDAALVEALTARGFRVARRTVAKYRGAAGIAPASLR